MSDRRTFIDKVLAGEVLDLERIDDEIDAWHASRTSGSLAAWLGMTDDDYQLFVERPDALRLILMSHKHGKDLRGLLAAADGSLSLAARGASTSDVQKIRDWLRKTGRL